MSYYTFLSLATFLAEPHNIGTKAHKVGVARMVAYKSRFPARYSQYLLEARKDYVA